MVQCKSCGRTIGEEYIYCSYCGKDTPKMEMLKKTEWSRQKGNTTSLYPGFVNRISKDFAKHYLLLILASILIIITLLCPMFQITKIEKNQGKTSEHFITSKLFECLTENFELNGEEGKLPEEVRNSGVILVTMNVASIVLVALFLVSLLASKDRLETYTIGRIAINMAICSLLATGILFTFIRFRVYGDEKFIDGIESASTNLTFGFYIAIVVVLFTKFFLFKHCENRISHWKYLTR